jgi:7-cyano-7-deazaguanine synthase
MSKIDEVIVYSGGLDSTVLLESEAKKGKTIHALNFYYGSKHNKAERAAARIICSLHSIKFIEINLNFISELFKSDLLQSGGEIPKGHYAEDNMKSTVVPFRNGIMLSIAIGYAESVGAEKVLLASHTGDHAIYPDCRPEFTEAISIAAVTGTQKGISIEAPFSNKTKADIVKLGIEINASFKLAYSCYNGQKRPCLACGTCFERTEAFMLNNIQDPALSDSEWVEAVKIVKDKETMSE